MSAAEYEFGWPSITELGTFTVDLSQSSMAEVPKKGKNGDYISKEWSIVVVPAKISKALRVTGVSQRHYDRIRVLMLTGLKNLTVVRGLAAPGQSSSFAPYIISGVD